MSKKSIFKIPLPVQQTARVKLSELQLIQQGDDLRDTENCTLGLPLKISSLKYPW